MARRRALAGRLERAGGQITKRFREALLLTTAALTREAGRDARARSDRLDGLTKRFAAARAAETRRAGERAKQLPGLEGRLRRAFAEGLRSRRARLDSAAQLFGAVNYLSVLARGYVLVKDETGRPLRRKADLSPPQSLTLQFADGEIGANVGGGAPKKTKRAKGGDEGQSTLF